MSNAKRAAQCRRLLGLLRDAGDKGVSVLKLIYDEGILRASGRILELRREGYDIETRTGPGGTAVYVLLAEPQLKLPQTAASTAPPSKPKAKPPPASRPPPKAQQLSFFR